MSAGWAAFWMLAAWLFGGICCFFVVGFSLATSGACVFWDGCPECRWEATHRARPAEANEVSAPQAPARASP